MAVRRCPKMHLGSSEEGVKAPFTIENRLFLLLLLMLPVLLHTSQASWKGPFSTGMSGAPLSGSSAGSLQGCKQQCLAHVSCQLISYSNTANTTDGNNCLLFDTLADTASQYRTFKVYKLFRHAVCADDANRRRSGFSCNFFRSHPVRYCEIATYSRRRRWGLEVSKYCQLTCSGNGHCPQFCSSCNNRSYAVSGSRALPPWVTPYYGNYTRTSSTSYGCPVWQKSDGSAQYLLKNRDNTWILAPTFGSQGILSSTAHSKTCPDWRSFSWAYVTNPPYHATVESSTIAVKLIETGMNLTRNTSNETTGMPAAKMWQVMHQSASVTLFELVTIFDLSGRDLKGTIPPALGKLTHLRVLLLDDSALIGTIPSEVGKLTRVQRLTLNENSLGGTIPSEAGKLVGVRILNLNNNLLSGTIPSALGKIMINILLIRENKLQGTIPSEIGGMAPCMELQVFDNLLTGTIPSEVGKLTRMLELVVSKNRLTGAIPSQIWTLVGVKELWFRSNSLSGTIHPGVKHLVSMSMFWLHSNRLTGTIPSELAEHMNAPLRSLHLAHNKFTSTIPCEFGKLTDMQFLRLQDNNLIGAIPTEVGNCKKVFTLFLFQNFLSGTIPSEFGKLTRSDNVQLDVNSMFGTIPSELGKLTGDGARRRHQRSTLSFFLNKLTGTIPSEVGRIFTVESAMIKLSRNKLAGTIPSEVGDLSRHRTISLDGNLLQGTIPSEIGKLSNLDSLTFDHNKLVGGIPSEVGGCSNIRAIKLAANMLTGTIPSEVGKVRQLSEIRLFDNQLRGPFPDVSKFKLSQVLVAQNMLSGIVGSEIYAVTIDFASNRLVDLPVALRNIPDTKMLDLSSNNLSSWTLQGVVPDKHHFWLAGSETHICSEYSLAGSGRPPMRWPKLQLLDVSRNPLGMSARDFLYSIAHFDTLTTITAQQCQLYGMAWFMKTAFTNTGDRACLGQQYKTGFQSLVQLDFQQNFITVLTSPPPTLIVANFAHNRIRWVDSHWWRWVVDASYSIATINVKGNPLRETVWSPQKCPDEPQHFISNVNSFTKVTNRNYECTTVCQGFARIEADSELNVSMLCRCIPGYGGSKKNCRLCSEDEYEEHGNATIYLETRCRACPIHSSTFGQTGQTGVGGCHCKAGYMKDRSTGHCKACVAGRLSRTNRSTGCDACATGRFSSKNGSSFCDVCSGGSFANAEGVTNCLACQMGKYLASPGGTGCSLCVVGRFAAKIGSTSCDMCPGGSFANSEGFTNCHTCMVGKFLASPGGSQCAACPKGYIAPYASAACIPCLLNKIAADGMCEECSFLLKASQDHSECVFDSINFISWIAYMMSLACFIKLLIVNANRHFAIIDVSLVRGRTILTTLKPHWLHSHFFRMSFRVILQGAGLRRGSCAKVQRAIVANAISLELLDAAGNSLEERRLDTSSGTLSLRMADAFLHISWPIVGVPLALPASLLLLTTILIGFRLEELRFGLQLGVVSELGIISLLTAASCSIACTFDRWCRSHHRTPLQIRLESFKRWLSEINPHPAPCPKGAGRAIAVGKLLQVSDTFQEFIQDRSAYFLDANILKPLTAKTQLSFAELVGPDNVNFFVSHFWGNAFQHFCASVKKHAQAVASTASHTDGSAKFSSSLSDIHEWQKIAYWICFCSNNQYNLDDELGGRHGWQKSSFYLALRSPQCQATIMILDDRAMPLTRSWCIFEILQTLELERERPGFGGLILCTETGVLNTGNGSVAVAMAVAKGVARLNLKDAKASSEDDKKMIDNLVLKEIGTFESLNGYVRRSIVKVLAKAQASCSEEFAKLFEQLQRASEVESEDARSQLFATQRSEGSPGSPPGQRKSNSNQQSLAHAAQIGSGLPSKETMIEEMVPMQSVFRISSNIDATAIEVESETIGHSRISL